MIRDTVPPDELGAIVDNLGLPVSGINLSYSNAGTIGTLDGELLIALKPGHRATQHYVQALRKILPERFPGVEFFFQPSDIITQILNFGQPAAIDLQVLGNDLASNMTIASSLMKRSGKSPAPSTCTCCNVTTNRPCWPTWTVRACSSSISRAERRAEHADLAVRQFSDHAVVLDQPAQRVQYPLQIQTPQYNISSVDDLLGTPISASGRTGMPLQLLGNLVQVRSTANPAVITHYNIRPAIDVYVSVEGRDLGAVAGEIDRIVSGARARCRAAPS